MDNFIVYPTYRIEMVGAFDELRNAKVNEKEWCSAPISYWSELRYRTIDTLYNHLDLHEYRTDNIGTIFYDEEEGIKTHIFCKWFDDLTEEIGWQQSNESYINHPEWYKAYPGAQEIYDLLIANDMKYNFSKNYAAFCDTPFSEWKKLFPNIDFN